ncbi:MAG: hypothetical protein CSB33_04410 [Desulfobacterales bacterium]|nr:MAG: hypothetical protein CSB33_04410 [Desulfobacterales bacterium]
MKQGMIMAGALFAATLFLMTGCAGYQRQARLPPHDFLKEVASGELAPKVGRAVILLDRSDTMGAEWQGGTQLSGAAALAGGMVKTLVSLKIPVTLHAFGGDAEDAVIFRPEDLKNRDIPLSDLTPQGENTLGAALAAVVEERNASSAVPGEKTAVIIISNGMAADDPVAAAVSVRDNFGDQVCLYSLLVGEDTAGREMLGNTVWEAECGFPESAQRLMSPDGMAEFMKKVFLARGAAPVVPPEPETEEGVTPEETTSWESLDDRDGDGVADAEDQCPKTPRGAVSINEDGCWIIADIQFETNKTDINPEYTAMLDEIAAVMAANPDIRLALRGHTDSMGTAAYNMALSWKRARSVSALLAERGVDESHLIPVGMGFSTPLDINDTAKGRARNRRVHVQPLRVITAAP